MDMETKVVQHVSKSQGIELDNLKSYANSIFENIVFLVFSSSSPTPVNRAGSQLMKNYHCHKL